MEATPICERGETKAKTPIGAHFRLLSSASCINGDRKLLLAVRKAKHLELIQNLDKEMSMARVHRGC
jgi:hypothetical protein